jgi:hypothetical protein
MTEPFLVDQRPFSHAGHEPHMKAGKREYSFRQEPLHRNLATPNRVSEKIRKGVMRTRRSSGIVSTTIALMLMAQAMMGAAFGLAFGLALVLINPAFARLLQHSGDSSILIFVVTLVTTFASGATLTGLVFFLEDKEF